jgi:hypothetical protein
VKYAHPGDLQTYTDRKLARFEDAPLDLETIVQIQCMACAGKRRDEILRDLAPRGITMTQIARVLDPHDESVSTPRRQERAGVGYAKMKGRFR